MLDFIKKNYQVGAPIEITTSAGVYSGKIEFISNKYIVLRQANEKICGIAGSDMFTFQADIPEDILTGKVKWEAGDCEGCESDTDRGNHRVLPMDNGKAEKQKYDTVDTEDTDTDPVEAEQKQPLSVSLAEPKVVGQIDLKKLQEIDPKFSSRNYFMRTDDQNKELEETVEQNDKYDVEDDDESEHDRECDRHLPYVPAKGRITYFNSEYRYGFIHDFASDADLYFKLHQVAEPMLFDRIRKGTKVVYTIDHNAQGPTANCLHLPHPVNTLFIIAENCIDSYKLYFARQILEHILEIYPDNKDAQDLLEEAQGSECGNGKNYGNNKEQASAVLQYNPSVLYSQAKRAYLKKDLEEAEKLYMEAIKADERPESCVKDLLTLYVYSYKQSEDESIKAESKDKAMWLLEKYHHVLSDNMTSKQFLALNFYLPIGEYEKFMTLVDEILTAPQIANIISRRVFYLWQKAIALNKLGRKDEALALIDSTLELSPHNRQLLSLKSQILRPESKDEAYVE